ncbi:hypothetical protein DJ81_15335 [Halorubrum sp. Hd13]|nr:hypothetical protein DJ81_15335 [Halorubrum sp. Hd13]
MRSTASVCPPHGWGFGRGGWGFGRGGWGFGRGGWGFGRDHRRSAGDSVSPSGRKFETVHRRVPATHL